MPKRLVLVQWKTVCNHTEDHGFDSRQEWPNAEGCYIFSLVNSLVSRSNLAKAGKLVWAKNWPFKSHRGFLFAVMDTNGTLNAYMQPTALVKTVGSSGPSSPPSPSSWHLFTTTSGRVVSPGPTIRRLPANNSTLVRFLLE